MPELPEVETIRRVIEPQIRGLTIEEIVVNRPEVIAHPAADEFCSCLSGQRMERVTRRGKYFVIHLKSGDRIIIHLRMTGCLLVMPEGSSKEKHTHIIFRLNGGMELRFSDTRRFGRIWLLRKDETDIYSGIEKLGKEPFDQSFTAGYLSDRLGKRKKALKECLMEQSVIAGIGNIYSDEILFSAGIDPARAAESLTLEEWQRLAEVIPGRLLFYIQKNEITPEEYRKTRGRDYRNTPFLLVYGHEGEPCPICGTTLRRRVLGGRSSISCSNCQK